MSYQWSPTHAARNECLFADTANSRGTDITAGGSNNTKGSWITAAQNSFAYEYIIVGFQRGSAQNYLIDLGIDDGAGNVFVLAEDLHFYSLKGSQETYAYYGLPLHVPSGSRLTARCQCSSASQPVSMVLNGFSAGLNGMPGFSRMISLFTSSGGSRGVDCDPGGTANTKTRTQLIASSAARVAALAYFIEGGTEASRLTDTWALDIECGASSAEQKLIADLVLGAGATLDAPVNFSFPLIPCDVPASTRFSANLQCSVTTAGDRVLNIGLWGFVP